MRKTATATGTAAETKVSGVFFRGRGAQAGFDVGFEVWLGEETGGRGRAREFCEGGFGALELLRVLRMELRVLLFMGWRSSSEGSVFAGNRTYVLYF